MCANILLAAGASPTMAHNIREVEESVAGARALARRIDLIDAVFNLTEEQLTKGARYEIFQV